MTMVFMPASRSPPLLLGIFLALVLPSLLKTLERESCISQPAVSENVMAYQNEHRGRCHNDNELIGLFWFRRTTQQR